VSTENQYPLPEDAKARKSARPFWKKKRFIIPAAFVALIVVGSAAGGSKPAQPAAVASPTASASTSSNVTTYTNTGAPTPAAYTPTPTPTPTPTQPKVAAQHYKGAGDDVVTLKTPVTSAAVVTFTCQACSSNTVLKSDGRESLLVNEIGAYSGTRLINIHDNSLTTTLTVNADAAWTIDVADVFSLKETDGPASGHGDKVLLYYGPASASKAKIKNVGESNFAVKAYGSGIYSPLLVNEIGSYQGTVPFSTPAIVEISSSGDWSITPQ
jgi:hypothetical protein